ncbi:hypothetical protein GCM10010289_00450 [Streptomyces violascens]|uniref:Uncharacterized protein n=1 Tax=Streptomyces violascens TaxID=67381 RepID=A0ABQ3QRV6_9ACTN|nr:hypothetical protein GCM10010289_00450 [Streptomyces violascens]GHI39997.1 hypothetical protein Sviol_44050 [Streptomyces violascens]
MSEEFGEGPAAIAGSGDVRAGDPHVEKTAFQFGCKGVLRSHDPAGDLAGAGYVGADGFGVAREEGGEMFARGWLCLEPVLAADRPPLDKRGPRATGSLDSPRRRRSTGTTRDRKR